MQSSSPDRRDVSDAHPSPQRLTLTTPSPRRQTDHSHGLSIDTSMNLDGAASPTQPTWSPLTPTSSQPQSAPPEPVPSQPSEFAKIPPEPEQAPQPVSLEENPDAIALRNAISILQLQRQQSIKHIQSLERLQEAAVKDPQGFLNELKDGKLAPHSRAAVMLDEDDSAGEEANSTGRAKFGSLPAKQNIVRCPPVNWDKYHVVGESLDKLHEYQRKFPGVTDEQIQRSGHPPKHEVFAPYRPGIDKLEEKATNAQGKIT